MFYFWLIAIVSCLTTLQADNALGFQDCFPEYGANKQGCLERGCLWVPVEGESQPFCRIKNDCTRNGKIAETEQDCMSKGCVWNPTTKQGIPWCYEAPPCFQNVKATENACYHHRQSCSWESGSECRFREPKLIKIDCQPESYRLEPWQTRNACLKKGCIWDDGGIKGEPYCFFDTENFGYDVIQKSETKNGISAILKKRGWGSLFGKDYQILNLTVSYFTDDNVRILIEDAAGMHPGVPHEHMDQFAKNCPKNPPEHRKYDITLTEQPFSITVTRRSTGVKIFDSKGLAGPIYSKRYIQMSTSVPSDNLYGIGEHAHNSFRRNFNREYWPLFSRDFPPIGANEEHWNLYGVHPFYLAVENDGNAHGVLLMNAHAMSMQLQPNPNIVTYRTVGGKLDFLIYLGPEPDSVVQQHTTAVGRPYMPPYWSLGYQLSRWGYGNTETINRVHERNKRAGIPMDVHYVDIDYMTKYWDFTYAGNTGFEGFPKFIEKVHRDGMKMVPIMDPGVPSTPNPDSYLPLKNGLDPNIFIKSNSSGKVESFQGSCWPGKTFWPDFTDPNVYAYWYKQHERFHEQIAFDGMWYDMNEPSNFQTESHTFDCQQNDMNFPPYAPNMDRNLNWKTICMDAVQYKGRHFDLHSLFGFFEAKVSQKVLSDLKPGKRPFVISRSTFPGAGAFGAHWTGDVYSLWYQLKLSIIGILDFNLFGIPQVGADICGFNGEATEELCIRWHQLGVFYPFSRNHNTRNVRDQDPAAWSPTGMEIIKSSIQLRYRLLPYLYTLFHDAHIEGKTVARPLFFEFPKDPITRSDPKGLAVDTQFMLGPAVMVAPVLWENTLMRQAYFPEGRWFHLVSGQEVAGVPGYKTISTPIDQVSAYLRGGHILPMQKDNVTTVTSRKNPMQLLIALDANEMAQGKLFWDDGESLNNFENGNFDEFSFSAFPWDNKLVIIIQRDHRNRKVGNVEILLNKITIYGLQKNTVYVSRGIMEKSAEVVTIKDVGIAMLREEWEFTIVLQF